MSSSPAIEPDTADLVCQLDNFQGMVDALACVGWKRHQDALIELSEHGIVLIVEESGYLQAKVYLQRELFTKYEYGSQGRPRFGISLGLLVDCLNTFSSPGHSKTIEIKYPGPDMKLLLKYEHSISMLEMEKSNLFVEERNGEPEGTLNDITSMDVFPAAALELASATSGEAKISPTLAPATGETFLPLPSMEDLRRAMEEKCLKSYKIVQPGSLSLVSWRTCKAVT